MIAKEHKISDKLVRPANAVADQEPEYPTAKSLKDGLARVFRLTDSPVDMWADGRW